MTVPHLLLHLPEGRNRLESSAAAIEEHRALAAERGYVWICKPGRPLDPSWCEALRSAVQQGDEVQAFLYARLNLDERQLALYRARILDLIGPGFNQDKDHISPRLRKKSCGTWLKLTEPEPFDVKQIHRLQDMETGEQVSIWTDLQTDAHLVCEGEVAANQPQQTAYSYWLLCLSQPRTKAEFDRAWKFRPIATYQPGSADLLAEHETGKPQRLLVYDRVFGSSTYLSVLGVYEIVRLVAEGTMAGALLYAAQLRQVVPFPSAIKLNPRQERGLWDQLKVAQDITSWEELESKVRILLPLPDRDFEQILSQAGQRIEPTDVELPALESSLTAERLSDPPLAASMMLSDPAMALGALEAITAKPVRELSEIECYHLLRSLERALRVFIDYELSQTSRDWWAEGRLPLDSRIRAEERKQRREHPFPWLNQQDLPSKEYLDFSDYAEIITMDCNWNEVFESIFIRPEVIRGKLIELGILRNDIAHMRELQPLDKETFVASARQLLLMILRRVSGAA